MNLVPFDKLPALGEIQDVSFENLPDLFKICQKLEALCRKENGIGLSAVQVGLPIKLFAVKADEGSVFDPPGKFGFFCNMSYTPKKYDALLTNEVLSYDYMKILSLEGCLSIRSSNGRLRHFQVPRFPVVQLSGHRLMYDNELKMVEIQNLEISIEEQSIVFQHEIDHDHCVTINQIGKEVFLWN